MAHKGFADDINLIGGVTELLVNRHSCVGNTAVSYIRTAKVECEDMTSEKQWRLKRTFYMETRRHFKKTWRYRLTFNLKQAVVPLFYCATAPLPRMERMAASPGGHGHHIPIVYPPLRMENRYGSTVRHVRWENAPTTCLSFGRNASVRWHTRSWMDYRPLHAHGSTARLSETERKNRLHISLINRNFAA